MGNFPHPPLEFIHISSPSCWNGSCMVRLRVNHPKERPFMRTTNSKVRRAFSSERGFSLTELMIVLVIIGILVLLALPKLMPVVTKAKATEAKLQLKQVHTLEARPKTPA